MSEVHGITVSRFGHEILANVSITLEPGITALLGPNGAGKTTLLEAIGGSSRDVGYMPQHWRPIPGFTVRDGVVYAGWLKGLARDQSRLAVEQALNVVDLEKLADRKASRLSGGERQRAGLAESVVHRPDLLLLDEPTVGLDPEQRSAFRAALSRGLAPTVLLSTHLVDDVVALANRVVVLDEGRVAFDGSLNELADVASTDGDIESAYISVLARHRSSR